MINKMEKQEVKKGWCPVCRRMTQHISTLNPVGFWICTNAGCYGHRDDKLVEKEPQSLNTYGYL